MFKNSNYINALMRNHSLSTDSADDAEFQSGGTMVEDMPTGGFPPIYLCDKIEGVNNIGEKEAEKIKREFTAPIKTISIKSIMEKRRKNDLMRS
jgi:hypothetical protein